MLIFLNKMTFKNIFDKNPCINLHVKYLFWFLLGIVLFIISFPYCVKKYYIMNESLFTIYNHSFDCWSLSHYLCYTFIGFLFPHYWKIVIIIGILWELFEYIGYHIEKYVFRTKNIYWCAKFSDIIVNSLGFITGLFLRIIISYIMF